MNREGTADAWLRHVTFLEDRRFVDRAYADELGIQAEQLSERDTKRYRAVRVSDTVLELEAAPGWCAFFRLVGQGGVPVVGEVRIYPVERHPFRPLGIWSGEALGSVASVPAGGITARLFRSLRIDRRALATLVRSRVHEFAPGGHDTRDFRTERGSRRAGGVGRPRTPSEVLAHAAIVYEEACRAARPPLQSVAQRLRVKPVNGPWTDCASPP